MILSCFKNLENGISNNKFTSLILIYQIYIIDYQVFNKLFNCKAFITMIHLL